MTITADAPTTAHAPVARLGFTVERAMLANALATVGLAVPKRPVLPSLGGVLFWAADGQLTISATDNDTTVTVRVPGTVASAGTLLVDHGELTKLLGALVKGTRKRDADALPVTVRMLADGTPIVDLAGYTMPVTAYSVGEYPTIPDAVPTLAQVDRDAFARDVARVMIAVSNDTTVPALTGINLGITLGAVTLAATDRYRLVVAPLAAVLATHAAENARALVPGELLAAVVKRFTGDRVRIGLDDTENPSAVSFICGPITMSVRVLPHQFPPVVQLIPDAAAGVVQTDRAAMLAATRRAAAVLDAKRQGGGHVGVTITGETVSVAPLLDEHADIVSAPAQPATVDGIADAQRFRFTPAYLADALGSFTGDTITLHAQADVNRPVLVTDSADGLTDPAAFRHLIMPVREPRN